MECIDTMFGGRPRLRRAEASVYLSEVHGLPIAPATLAKYASIGGGPPMQYSGRFPLYPRDGLDRWALDRLGDPVASTSERV